MVMDYIGCYGVEFDIANCSGFDYDTSVFSEDCSPETTAGVKCLSKPSI